MTNGAKGKTLSRLVALLFMGLAFAGCVLMLTGGNRSLFADVSVPAYAAASQ